ncbi:tetratricopeptide repeat protein [Bacteroidota bacterium]
MQRSKIFLTIALISALFLSGFQCSSTELTSARLYIQNDNYGKAIEVLKQDVTKNPKSDEGWFLLGHCYAELSRVDSMMISFDNSLSASDKFAEDINNRKLSMWVDKYNSGVNLFQRGNDTQSEDSSKIYYNKSIEAFETAATLQPDSTDAYKNMAFVYMRSGRNEEAIKPFKKLVDLNQELDGYRYLGEIYYSMGIIKKSSFQATGNIQDSLDAAESFTNAIDILEQGSMLYSTNDEISRLLNASYVENGRIDEALESTKILVNKEPQNKTYRYNYGVLLLQIDDYSGAEEQLKYALDIDPEYENAIYNLAVNYVKWGTYLSKEEEKTENYTGAYKKKYEEAMPYLQSVIKSDPENVEIWELLGKVYSILGMQEEALDAYDNADRLR